MMTLNIYHVEPKDYNLPDFQGGKPGGYDTYTDFVVAAENEQEAILLTNHDEEIDENGCLYWGAYYPTPQCLKATFLGIAHESVEKGIICYCFHAG